MTIHKKIIAAQAEMKAAGKSGDNKFDKYKYSKLEDFYDACKPTLAKHGLALTLSTDEVIPLEGRTTKNGGVEHCVRVRVTGTLMSDDGSSVSVSGYGEGQDRADKAIYKAITGARKYVLAGLLAIPATDDPEADETVGLSDKRGSTAKVASITGEVRKSKPPWSPEMITKAGEIRSSIINLGGDPADKEVVALKARMAYDDPDDIIATMIELEKKWADINNQAKG